MTKEQAQLFCDALEASPYDGEYSGRGMYGNTTHAVVYDDAQTLFYQIGSYLQASVHSEMDEDEAAEVCDLGAAIKRLQMDSLGLKIVVY